MNEDRNLQQFLFERIKEKLPPHLSLVDELSDILNISDDSVYRRLRGEKPLTINELQKISDHFNISLDSILKIKSQNVIFHNRYLDSETFNFEQFLTAILKDIEQIYSHKEKKITYFAKEVPIFHFFHFPALAAFKLFVWLKTVLQFPDYNKKKFAIEDVMDKHISIGKKILDIYNLIPTVEIWNYETLNSVIRQFEFYLDSDLFEDKRHLNVLIDDLEKMVNHLFDQATHGFKFKYGNPAEGVEGNYNLYYNEVILGDNTLLVQMDDSRVTYLTHNVINSLITSDPEFGAQTEESLNILKKKSTLISVASEKERNKFFNKLYYNINSLRNRI